jgi:hypothetical protein
MQELPNLVNTKLSRGKKTVFLLGLLLCRTETMSYQSK